VAVNEEPRRTGGEGWGWCPAVGLLAALGLLILACANTAARHGAAWPWNGFWVGLLLIFVPIAARLLSSSANRQERLGLAALLGVGLFLVKVLQYPTDFRYADELMHWRTADDILQMGRLHRPNPVLPVSPLFPGLENLTTAVASLSGLSIFAAGTIVLGVARLTLVLALFHLYESISGSARVAGLGVLLYAANPNFLFFGVQFAYESLALPLTTVALFALVRRDRRDGSMLPSTVLACLALAAVVTTHHVTTYMAVLVLGLWALVDAIFRRWRAPGRLDPVGMLVILVVAGAAWLIFAANLVVGYLAPKISKSAEELLRFMAREESGRELFQAVGGELPPLWERLAGFGATGLTLLVLPPGLLVLWVRHRRTSAALALGCLALAYPGSLALRFTSTGAELANRATSFLFLALAFVLALTFAAAAQLRPFRGLGRAVLVGWIAVIFVGGPIVGWARWARLPGPYLVSADARSIEAESLAAAHWARAVLGPNNRMAADRANRLLMLSYGRQFTTTSLSSGGINVGWVYFAREIRPKEREMLRKLRVDYLLVDQRLTQGLPQSGTYFERGEPNSKTHTQPMDPGMLAKFDHLDGVSRLYDSGNIQIYDVRGYLRDP